MNKFLTLLKSRKFWAAVVGLAVIVIKSADPNFPIAEADLSKIVFLLVAYILGTGLSDLRTA